jgi:release factor glutamine methyltransferase
VLRRATAVLRAAGIPGPERDARRLLAHALGLDPVRLPLAEGPVAPEAAARFAAALAARCAGQPVAQIVGQRAFWGLSFLVTPDVLDPRPETETLVAAALEGPFSRVLDLGTGSGCILLSLLADRPGAAGLGIDASAAALAVAERNAAALGLADRATFRLGNWTEGIEGPFDLIVSNPPYVTEADWAELSREVRDWEPRAALVAGADGLDAYRAILADAPRLLAEGGRILLEVGAGQASAVVALCCRAGLAATDTRADLDGRPRVVVASRP